MLTDRDFIALALVLFVPLIVIVEDHRDYFVEAIDESIGRSLINEPVKPAVEVRKILKTLRYLVQQ